MRAATVKGGQLPLALRGAPPPPLGPPPRVGLALPVRSPPPGDVALQAGASSSASSGSRAKAGAGEVAAAKAGQAAKASGAVPVKTKDEHEGVVAHEEGKEEEEDSEMAKYNVEDQEAILDVLEEGDDFDDDEVLDPSSEAVEAALAPTMEAVEAALADAVVPPPSPAARARPISTASASSAGSEGVVLGSSVLPSPRPPPFPPPSPSASSTSAATAAVPTPPPPPPPAAPGQKRMTRREEKRAKRWAAHRESQDRLLSMGVMPNAPGGHYRAKPCPECPHNEFTDKCRFFLCGDCCRRLHAAGLCPEHPPASKKRARSSQA